MQTERNIHKNISNENNLVKRQALAKCNKLLSMVESLSKKHGFIFKHVGELDYFLGAYIERNEKVGGRLTFGLRTYIAKILESYQRMFGELPKHSKCPMEPGVHTKIDETPLLDVNCIKKYQSLMGML